MERVKTVVERSTARHKKDTISIEAEIAEAKRNIESFLNREKQCVVTLEENERKNARIYAHLTDRTPSPEVGRSNNAVATPATASV